MSGTNVPFTAPRLKRNKIIILTLSTALIAAILIYDTLLARQIKQLDLQWERYNSHLIVASDSLNTIRASLGYGGFIHNFKNLVLRQEHRYFDIVAEDIQRLNMGIANYQKLSLNAEEAAALNNLSSVINIYSDKFELAKQTLRQDSPTDILSEALDEMVRVDDQPALEALKKLAQTNIMHSRETSLAAEAAISSVRSLGVGYSPRSLFLMPFYSLSF